MEKVKREKTKGFSMKKRFVCFHSPLPLPLYLSLHNHRIDECRVIAEFKFRIPVWRVLNNAEDSCFGNFAKTPYLTRLCKFKV